MFRGGLCGAVRRESRSRCRRATTGSAGSRTELLSASGPYGFVDEDGREIVEPKYRIVDANRSGFVQFDVDGKSGHDAARGPARERWNRYASSYKSIMGAKFSAYTNNRD